MSVKNATHIGNIMLRMPAMARPEVTKCQRCQKQNAKEVSKKCKRYQVDIEHIRTLLWNLAIIIYMYIKSFIHTILINNFGHG